MSKPHQAIRQQVLEQWIDNKAKTEDRYGTSISRMLNEAHTALQNLQEENDREVENAFLAGFNSALAVIKVCGSCSSFPHDLAAGRCCLADDFRSCGGQVREGLEIC